jgi:hypothetical protein
MNRRQFTTDKQVGVSIAVRIQYFNRSCVYFNESTTVHENSAVCFRFYNKDQRYFLHLQSTLV